MAMYFFKNNVSSVSALFVLKKNPNPNQTLNLLKGPFEGLHIKPRYIDQSGMQCLHHFGVLFFFLPST